jgi:hypothetical protein
MDRPLLNLLILLRHSFKVCYFSIFSVVAGGIEERFPGGTVLSSVEVTDKYYYLFWATAEKLTFSCC